MATTTMQACHIVGSGGTRVSQIRRTRTNPRHGRCQGRQRVMRVLAGDFPTPDLDTPSNTNYQEAKALSRKIKVCARTALGSIAFECRLLSPKTSPTDTTTFTIDALHPYGTR
eukprot:1194735-Prorocentrum_minimum.AAC.4